MSRTTPCLASRSHLALAVLLACCTVLLISGPASAAVNGFNATDGNKDCAAGEKDWACIADVVEATDGSGVGDDVYVDGSKESDQNTWRLGTDDKAAKTDLVKVWGAAEHTATDSFLYLGFERTSPDGQAYLSLEMGQSNDSWTNAKGVLVPCRTGNDVLVSYAVPSTDKPAIVGAYRWVPALGADKTCGEAATGSWEALNLGSASEGTLNGTFGEAALDLTAVAGALPAAQPCTYYRNLRIRSRPSLELTAALGDYVAGEKLNALACKPKSNDLQTLDAPTLTAATSCADGGTVKLSGTAPAGSSVAVYDGPSSVGVVTPDASGNWTLTLTGVKNGTHGYSAMAFRAGWNSSARSATTTVSLACATTSTGTDGGGSGTGDAGTTGTTGGTSGRGVLGTARSARCRTKPFSLGLRGIGAKRVVFKVDGRRVSVDRKRNRKGLFTVRIDPRRFRAGEHRVSATLVKKNGRTRTVPMRSFSRCKVGKCVSRRSFRIRVKKVRGDRVVSATVLVNGRKVKVVRGKRLTAPVRLTGLPKGRVKVQVRSRLASGRTVRETRTYRTCVPKKKSTRK